MERWGLAEKSMRGDGNICYIDRGVDSMHAPSHQNSLDRILRSVHFSICIPQLEKNVLRSKLKKDIKLH